MAIQNFKVDLDTSRFVSLNDINVGLRHVTFSEGSAYSGSVSVYSNGTLVEPGELTVTLNNANNTLIYVTGSTTASGYYLNVVGGSLRQDLCDSETIQGLLNASVSISGNSYPISPLSSQLIANTATTLPFAGVDSINGQSGTLNLLGSGDIQVFGSSNNILVGYTGNTGQFTKNSQTGVFATAANLLLTGQTLQSNLTGASGALSSRLVLTGSGLEAKITGLSGLVTGSSGALSTRLASTGASLQSQINAIGGITGTYTGVFYPRTSNPSGYLTSGSTGSFITTSQTGQFVSSGRLTQTGNSLQSQINVISGITGGFTNQFYPRTSNPSGYVTSGQTGILATVANLAATGASLQNQINAISGGTGFSSVRVTGSNNLSLVILSGAGNVNVRTGVSGLVIVSGTTGGFVDNFILTGASGALSVRLASTGSNLQSQINTISGITGTYTGIFYPRTSNPSGYLTSVSTGSFITTGQTGAFASAANLASTGSNLQAQITSITTASGNLSTVRVTGSSGLKSANFVGAGNVTVFLPSGTLSGNVIVSGNTGAYADFLTNGYVTGISGVLQNQINNLNTFSGATTGLYYPRFSNPSGYVWTGQTGAFAAVVNLASTGSNLQGQINSLSGNLTGSLNLIPSTIRVSGSTFITGANFTGVNGAAVFHSGDTILVSGTIFNSGFFSGALDKKFLHNTGDENITGIKYFASRPFVGTGISGMISGTGVLLSGEATAIKVTGSATLNVATLTGIGGAQVMLSGSNILISGGAGGAGGGAGSGVSLLVATGSTNSGGFTGNVLLSGAGNVTAFTGTSRVIIVSGNTGAYANFITPSMTGGFANASALFSTGANLQSQILSTQSQIFSTGANLENRINAITGQACVFDSGIQTNVTRQTFQFPIVFTQPPFVFTQLKYLGNTGTSSPYIAISGVTTSGFTGVYNTGVTTTGYVLSIWATSGASAGGSVIGGGGSSSSITGNWSPDIPPANPFQYDDEFNETGTLPGGSSQKWTWYNQNNATARITGGDLVMKDVGAGDSVSLLMQSISGFNPPWTLTTKLVLNDISYTTFNKFGLAISGVDNKFCVYGFRWGSSSTTLFQSNQTATNAGTEQTTNYLYNPTMYLRIVTSGTGLHYCLSKNGNSYVPVYSGTLSGFLSSGIITGVGLMVDAISSTPTVGSFEYIRMQTGAYLPFGL